VSCAPSRPQAVAEDPAANLSVSRRSERRFAQVSAANAFAFNLPPIMGLGNSSGFEFQIESLGGAPPAELAQVARALMVAAQDVPELTKGLRLVKQSASISPDVAPK
jgi:multidrug efflux pump subunit AcrB